MPSVVVRPQAEADIFEIASYIAKDDPSAAERWIDAIEAKFELLATSPKLGRSRADLARGIRSFAAGSYLIFYDGIEVVRVLHGKRDIGRQFER